MQSCMPFSEACIALNQNGSARRKRILPLLCVNGHLGLKPTNPSNGNASTATRHNGHRCRLS
jgi:hypothetical protein